MEALITRFYGAFNALDAETMAACYHDDITFEDPAFGILKGEQARNMWRMLCHSQMGKDFKVIASDISANNNEGSAQWEAFYTFGRTGRPVHNIIEAKFTFQNGKIIQHKDTFNLHRWSGQALGLKGKLLGWTPFFKKNLQAQTIAMLNKFEQKNQTST